MSVHSRSTATTGFGPLQRLSLTVVLLLVGAMLAACGTGQEAAAPTQVAPATETDVVVVVPTTAPAGTATAMPAEEPMAATLSEIADNPEQYMGQQVIVRGDLTEVLGPRSFTLNDPAVAGLDSLLVVGATEAAIPQAEQDLFTPDASQNAQLQVTGTVREFDQALFEQEIGYRFPNEQITGFAGRTAILADEVEVLSRGAAAGQVGGAVVEDGIITLSDIDDDTAAYLGQTVTVNGEVDESLGANAFRMDEGGVFDLGDQILVVIGGEAMRPANLQNETSVQVTGEVRNFARTEFEQEYGTIFDDEALYATFEGQPAIVASDVAVRASVSDIDDDEEAYIGNRVTVLGDVTEIIDARSFRLDDPAFFGGDDILVTMAQEGMQVNAGDQVYVTGTVREFDRAALGAETGYEYGVDYDPFAENTVIVAESISLAGQAAAGAYGDAFDETRPSILEIASDPAQYAGQQFELYGEVSEALGPNTFRLDEDNVIDIGDDILVVVPEGVAQPPTLVDGTNVVVDGTVRQFVLAEFEREYGFFGDAELYAEFENRAAFVADAIYLQATLSDVDDNPEAYIGNRVTVIGRATELLGPSGGFRLEDPGFFAGDDVLVLARDQALQVAEDQLLMVTGTVQRFNLTDTEQELGYDLDDELFTGWTDRTVIIADAVQPRGQ